MSGGRGEQGERGQGRRVVETTVETEIGEQTIEVSQANLKKVIQLQKLQN